MPAPRSLRGFAGGLVRTAATLAVAGGVLVSAPFPAVAVTATDTTAPALVDFGFSPATVDITDAGQAVTVTAHVTDATGAQAPYVLFDSDSTDQTAGFGAMSLTSGTAQDGVFTRTVTIPQGAATGTWSAVLYPLQDTVGNSGSFGPPAGFPRTLTVTGPVSDTAPPTLVAFDFTPKSIDISSGGQDLVVTAHVTDATGAQAPYVLFDSDSTDQTAGFGAMSLTSGTAQDGVFTRTVTIPQGAATGTWSAVLYPLQDTVGNSGSFGPPPSFPKTAYVSNGPAATAPDAPSAVTAVPGNMTATVSWTAPSSDGGAPIRGYTVTADPGGGTCSTVGALSCAVPGLSNGISYTFTVTARNDLGTGAASAPSPAVVPATVPSPPQNVIAVAEDAAANVQWTAPDSDGGAPIAQYRATASPGGASCTTTLTSCTIGALSNGITYAVTVTATNAMGISAPASPAPSVTPRTAPGAPTSVSSAVVPSTGDIAVSWSAPAWNGGSAVTGYTVTSDPVGAGCSGLPGTADPTRFLCTLPNSSFVNGTSYTFAIQASNAAGDGPASSTAPVIARPADTTAPTVTTSTLPVYSLASSLLFRYTGADSGWGVASFDVRYRRAAFNGGYSSLMYPATWQQRTSTTVSVAIARGYTFCFSARSRDRAGNVSPWSAERCSAVPLDDRSLVASTGWLRTTSTAYYAATVTTVAKTGATLTRTSVQARRLAVVATRCPTCGSIAVYWNGTLIRQISLRSSTTMHRQLLTIADFGTVRSGALVIKTLSSSRVFIDGLATSRA